MDAAKARTREDLSADSLAALLRQEFAAFEDPRARVDKFSLVDALMSAFAVFHLKDPSLLAFQQRERDDNFHSLYKIAAVPSDTRMRELLDPIAPSSFRPAFKAILGRLQRGKALESMRFLDEGLILSLDGCEYFCSDKVHCESCMRRQAAKSGGTQYHHQMLAGVIVHPDRREVIPVAPEPIQRQDGEAKIDCERNAARRFLANFRADHPRLKVVVVEDGLASNGPHLRDLKAHDCRFILGAKDGDHAALQRRLEAAGDEGTANTWRRVDADTGVAHHFVWLEGVPLNDSHPDLLVNYLRCAEELPNGSVKEFSWVTDLRLGKDTVFKIMRAGRARWKIENETFNTLKNQGYHFEHNFGHGRQNLGTNFAMLMMLVFLFDQTLLLCCPLFGQAKAVCKSIRGLWEKVRTLFDAFQLASLNELYQAIAFGIQRARPDILTPNTS